MTPSLESFVFLVGIAALLLHELDAIQQGEWRFFFGGLAARLGRDERFAYRLFTAAHLPLFLLILWLLPDARFQIAQDLFLIVHLVLHGLLRHHPLIRFNTVFSQLWIVGGAVAAGVHLLLVTG